MSGAEIVGAVGQPGVCDGCYPVLVDELEQRPNVTVATGYCEHRKTVFLVSVQPGDDGRLIARWLCESPVQPDQAGAMTRRLANAFGDHLTAEPPERLQ